MNYPLFGNELDDANQKSRRLKVAKVAHDIRRRVQPKPRASQLMEILTLVLLSLVNRTKANISLGFAHSCAVHPDGSAYCWGGNWHGQLGDGTVDPSGNPFNPTKYITQSVSGITTATSISSGVMHSCAVLTDKTVKCWGQNTYGQLGDGTTTSSSTPVSVSGISTAVSIALGEDHSCAVLTDRAIKCWGREACSQCRER